MFLFQISPNPVLQEESPYSKVEGRLQMSSAARALVREALEGRSRETELWFGPRSERKRDANFDLLMRELSQSGISCSKETKTDAEGNISFVLKITNTSVPAGRGAKTKSSKSLVPKKTRREYPDTYEPLAQKFGQNFISAVCDSAGKSRVNPVSILLVVTAENTSHRNDPQREWDAFAGQMKRNPNSRNSAVDSPKPKRMRDGTYVEQERSYSLPQIKESTFNDLVQAGYIRGFTFEQMKNDYRLALQAIAGLIRFNEKRIGVSSTDNPELLAVAHIRPREAEIAAGMDDWRAHYSDKKTIKGVRDYYSKIESYSEIISDSLLAGKSQAASRNA